MIYSIGMKSDFNRKKIDEIIEKHNKAAHANKRNSSDEYNHENVISMIQNDIDNNCFILNEILNENHK